MIKIILLNVQSTFFRLFEWLRVIIRYYRRDLKFIWTDLLLASQYLFKNPHRVSKAFLKKQGAKNVYGFGETPLTTLDYIAKQCRILSHDIVYELGCGTARSCFWLQAFVKCKVVGIDYLPTFIKKAQCVKKYARLRQIDLIEQDMLHVDLSAATVIYLYGTCLEEPMIEKLVTQFNHLRPGTKVITVSYPLTEYTSHFTLSKQFTGRFPWGTADIFLNIKK